MLAALTILPLAPAHIEARVLPRRLAVSQELVVLPRRSVRSSLRGKVVDWTGAAVGGALVQVVDTQTQKPVASQVVPQSGEFGFTNLPPGDHYKLRARRDGFRPLEIPLKVARHHGAGHLTLKLVVAS